MRVLITGNMGYVGSVVVKHLRRRYPDSELIGFDTGMFASCFTTNDRAPETYLTRQHFGDVREFPVELLEDVDAVLHLAAVSNDPMGKRFEGATDEINRNASLRLAGLAVGAGVRNFVFASSCSVYGAATGEACQENDPLNPLTAYARSKVMTEQGLAQMDINGMTTTCLRFATACGMSDRLRLDLVLNDFVASALATGKITVLSDGSPWRPLIDVRDMARAFDWAMTREAANGGRMLIVNVGSDERNHQVRELAEAVAMTLPGTSVSINSAAPPDRRSYRVDFTQFRRLASEYCPRETLQGSIAGLVKGLRAIGVADENPQWSGKLMRLNVLSSLVEQGVMEADLRWRAGA